MPYATSSNVGGYTCSSNQSPNSDTTADSTLNIASHEIVEAITDPTIQAWYDAGGYEIADECSFTFGASSGNPGTEYNQVINGHDYYLQEEFSDDAYATNPSDGCVQSGSPVIASFTESSSTVTVGSTVSFDGSSSTVLSGPSSLSYAWNFGDGSTASGSTTSHAYSSGGTYTVTLTVSNGTSQAVTSQTITVPTPPGSPQLSASAGTGQISLNWSTPSSGSDPIAGYEVYRSSSTSSEPGSVIATTSGTSFTDTSVSSGSSYDYAVAAQSSAGTSSLSNEVSASPITQAPSSSASGSSSKSTLAGGIGAGARVTVPGAPVGLAVVAGLDGATVSWSEPRTDGGSSVTKYTVTVSPGAITRTTSRSPLVFSGLKPGKRYVVTVSASNVAGAGATSAPVTFAPLSSAHVELARPTATLKGSTLSFAVRCTTARCAGTAALQPARKPTVATTTLLASSAPSTVTFHLGAAALKDLAGASQHPVTVHVVTRVAGGLTETLDVIVS